jgi:hypothetical protein
VLEDFLEFRCRGFPLPGAQKSFGANIRRQKWRLGRQFIRSGCSQQLTRVVGIGCANCDFGPDGGQPVVLDKGVGREIGIQSVRQGLRLSRNTGSRQRQSYQYTYVSSGREAECGLPLPARGFQISSKSGFPRV